MEQEVAHSRGGCNSRRALKDSGEMTSMDHIYIEDGSPQLRFRMFQVHRNGWIRCQVRRNGWIPNAEC